jgi:hypothetical protein
MHAKGDYVEDWRVSSAARILYMQNKLLGNRVGVITLFEFTLLFVEKKGKGYKI